MVKKGNGEEECGGVGGLGFEVCVADDCGEGDGLEVEGVAGR